MPNITPIDILIIGSGPAGMSTALHIVRKQPEWADRLVVVDKAIHPREKLCGGGLTQLGMEVLSKLDLALGVPSFPVHEVQLVYHSLRFSVQDTPIFWVVRRNEFDHWLVQTGQKWGIQVRQGEAVTAIESTPGYVVVTTEKTTYHARVVVAADGSRSFVRQALHWPDSGRMSRLLEVLTPEEAETQWEFQDRVAVFDFSAMEVGLQGYCWDFPSFIEGQPVMNRGVFDSRVRPERPRADLKGTLATTLRLRQRNLLDYPLKGHPIYRFDAHAQFARPHIILAGDAAGADPLFGEGISFALGFGRVAAAAIVDAFARQDFTFDDYGRRIRTDPLLAQLAMRTNLSRLAYRITWPWLLRLGWWLVPWLIGVLAWFNPRYVPIALVKVKRLK